MKLRAHKTRDFTGHSAFLILTDPEPPGMPEHLGVLTLPKDRIAETPFAALEQGAALALLTLELRRTDEPAT